MVTFSSNKALLQSIANTLATEATAAGLTSLSSNLSSFASEVEQSVTENEFFGGGTYTSESGTDEDSAALVWAQTLSAAAHAIKTKIHNNIKSDVDSIKDYMGIIQDDISRIRDLGDRDQDGLGFRTIQPYGEISVAILWLLYIERGKILELDLSSQQINDLLTQPQDTNLELRQASIARINQIIDRIKTSGFNSF